MTQANKDSTISGTKGTIDYDSFLEKYKIHRLEVEESQSKEPILMENKSRFVLMPIKFHTVYDGYKKREALFWPAEEIDFSHDIINWGKKASDHDKSIIKKSLAFLCSSVLGSFYLPEHISSEVQIPEAKCFYGFEIMVENIHGEVYSLAIDQLVHNTDEIKKMFKDVDNAKFIERKKSFAERWFDKESSLFAEKLVAFSSIEAIFSLVSFFSIMSLEKKDIIPGLISGIKLILKDHIVHCDFQMSIYSELKKRLDPGIIERIVTEAVEIELETLEDDYFNKQLDKETKADIKNVIEYVGDRVLMGFGNQKHFHSANPYDNLEHECFENVIPKTESSDSQNTTKFSKTEKIAASEISFDDEF
ncbi:hypothetical protein Kpol_1056p47 [Vanderwaltozyma polyspora DSM 70294]|uniref:Uncharacterized protein n=1 Tax=Vanderwaltozyma polyspora (strain ATCC 22028 / DSM 70294 / BCRC 21397 / CBS 2163 / NBRC 10782 / NRRL Y-8283 / UCD 57-17) TaxID=436907 RepID=A7TLQ4_VANPO|nr:uncharacterized protein Kpol_1056p47 [Vanderwaltozyma polyspora DSM 70294]EDO16846.1 hypothetical protein Kpol_1056p47 [Vanderwaltozyma polyspora DSM 70294]